MERGHFKDREEDRKISGRRVLYRFWEANRVILKSNNVFQEVETFVFHSCLCNSNILNGHICYPFPLVLYFIINLCLHAFCPFVSGITNSGYSRVIIQLIPHISSFYGLSGIRLITFISTVMILDFLVFITHVLLHKGGK